jgi:hypothetical protein
MDLMNTQATFENRPGEAPARKSTQPLMPVKLGAHHTATGTYNIYPVCSLSANCIFNGYASLAKWIIRQKRVIIDGYAVYFGIKFKQPCRKNFPARA